MSIKELLVVIVIIIILSIIAVPKFLEATEKAENRELEREHISLERG